MLSVWQELYAQANVHERRVNSALVDDLMHKYASLELAEQEKPLNEQRLLLPVSRNKAFLWLAKEDSRREEQIGKIRTNIRQCCSSC